MNVQIDMRVAELLASRLCHDLVGPIGAVNNGLELLEDEADDMSRDAFNLVVESAQRTATILQYFRLAHGLAGSRMGARPDDLRDLAARFLATGKANLEWDVAEDVGEPPEDLGKLLLNMILLGAEALVGGGTLSVAVGVGADGGLSATVTASGERVALREETRAALAEDVAFDDLTPRNVQAYFTHLLARRMDGELTLEGDGDMDLRIAAKVPARIPA